jgi:TonB family protein
VSSGRARGRSVSPASWGGSIAGHVLVLLLAAAAASRLAGPPTDASAMGDVTYLNIAEPEPAAEPVPETQAPEPPLPLETADFTPEPQEVTRPDLLAGFQELLPPREVTGIPEPSIAGLVDPADFSGRGVIGGVAGGRRPLASDTAEVKAEVPSQDAVLRPEMLYEQPRILNVGELGPRMEALYPLSLRAAGIEGRVIVECIVAANGRVEASSVKVVESSHVGFELPTRQLLELLRFEPGRQIQVGAVRALIQLPVDWSIAKKR